MADQNAKQVDIEARNSKKPLFAITVAFIAGGLLFTGNALFASPGFEVTPEAINEVVNNSEEAVAVIEAAQEASVAPAVHPRLYPIVDSCLTLLRESFTADPKSFAGAEVFDTDPCIFQKLPTAQAADELTGFELRSVLYGQWYDVSSLEKMVWVNWELVEPLVERNTGECDLADCESFGTQSAPDQTEPASNPPVATTTRSTTTTTLVAELGSGSPMNPVAQPTKEVPQGTSTTTVRPTTTTVEPTTTTERTTTTVGPTANERLVTNLYKGLLNRNDTSIHYDWWVGEFDKGDTMWNVRRFIEAASLEKATPSIRTVYIRVRGITPSDVRMDSLNKMEPYEAVYSIAR